MCSDFKLFRDTIHGYIEIPREYCSNFIDTPHFQRLRRIEQTTMRALYPCAHHDRFVHSIGTFHLGNKAFKHITENSRKVFDAIWGKKKEDKQELKRLEISFNIACLLHDVGHAPFSHIFEYYYNANNDLKNILKHEINDACFNDDYYGAFEQDDANNEPDSHEIMSAILVMKVFKSKIEERGGDPVLVSRMIIGCKYTIHCDEKLDITNCFIELLHGRRIDVDKLDYLGRDQWASGVITSGLNLFRLISSLCVEKPNGMNRRVLCYHKSALSHIHGVIEARNYSHNWIFCHHKVVYDKDLLIRSVEKLSQNIIKDHNKSICMSKLFNINSFLEPQEFGPYKIFLPSDDDIVFMLKQNYLDNPLAEEWLSRQHKLKPLWKTYSDYHLLVAKHFPATKTQRSIENIFTVILNEFCEDNDLIPESSFRIICPKSSPSTIRENDLYIKINGEVICYTKIGTKQVLPEDKEKNHQPHCLVYLNDSLMTRRNTIIDKLKNSIPC